MTMFKDRTDAGIQLAEKLIHFKDYDTVVIAIPRGGLPLAAIVAKTLEAPLDVALTKKIGHPHNKEYAIGAISLDSRILSSPIEASEAYIEKETNRIRHVLSKRRDQYYKNSEPQDVKGKTVIIIDDGIATGNTILATIELVYKKDPSRIVVAIPVAPPSALEKLNISPYVDEVVYLEAPYNFQAVGQFYDQFHTVTDEMAIRILEECNQNLAD
ncbi:phosphoribosyltransferase family protein [Aquimarina sp. MMG016]|uniref:phosphoribosyltransferase n=1 Tax=Aquimarina sp. MMG016 TaxID=2822690 RepID=UPI001FFD6251|nr:phosphoribosyltransferase family protein [Aquimarina sp. MMG016]